jgi:hypothetical protein
LTTYPINPIGALIREIPATARADMHVPVRVYADDELWRQIVDDRSLRPVEDEIHRSA